MGEDVMGRCPACGHTSLFLASGGYVTCRIAECPNPGAASDVLLTNGERKVLVGRTYATLSNSWSEWDKQFDEACAAVGERQRDEKASIPPPEVLEVVVTRRALVETTVAVREVTCDA